MDTVFPFVHGMSPPMRNITALVLSLIGCLAEMKIFELLVAKRVVSRDTCRKLIHIVTGPLYLICWPLFGEDGRYFAVVVPALLTVKVGLVGTGLLHDPETVNSMSRTGNKRELLLGPLMYGIVFVYSTVVYWRSSPAAIVAMMLLCAGDGFAGLFGKIYGRSSLPYNKDKTWLGTTSFIIGSLGAILFFATMFTRYGWIYLPNWDVFVTKMITVVGLSAMVESLPISDWDNIAVFVVGLVLFHNL